MVRKFVLFRSDWKKRSTSEGTPQFPNENFGKLPYNLTSNQNFWIFWPNGKHPRWYFTSGISQGMETIKLPVTNFSKGYIQKSDFNVEFITLHYSLY